MKKILVIARTPQKTTDSEVVPPPQKITKPFGLGNQHWAPHIEDLLELAVSPAQFNAAVDAVAQELGDVTGLKAWKVVGRLRVDNWPGFA